MGICVQDEQQGVQVINEMAANESLGPIVSPSDCDKEQYGQVQGE